MLYHFRPILSLFASCGTTMLYLGGHVVPRCWRLVLPVFGFMRHGLDAVVYSKLPSSILIKFRECGRVAIQSQRSVLALRRCFKLGPPGLRRSVARSPDFSRRTVPAVSSFPTGRGWRRLPSVRDRLHACQSFTPVCS